jgi:hypothetical protein
LTVLLVAVLLGIPGQHDSELGAELVVLAVVFGVGFFWLDRRATADRSAQPIFVCWTFGPAHDAGIDYAGRTISARRRLRGVPNSRPGCPDSTSGVAPTVRSCEQVVGPLGQ